MMPPASPAADLYATLASAFKPREVLSVSQWADAHRVLSAKASSEPNAWRTTRTPYLREIMDSLSDNSPVQCVDVMKAAQMGVTEAGVNWIGYVMDHVRSSKPMLTVLPTQLDIPNWVAQRLNPLLKECTPLRALFNVERSRDESNRRETKDYPGGIFMLMGANTPIKSVSVRFVFCDEFDEFGWDVGGQGDPMGMIESRAANFPRRKFFVASTPTIKGASRIEERFQRSDQRYYQVPCPHCGQYFRLIWENLRWDAVAARAWYVCVECGAEIDEHCKTEMLARGRWVASRTDADRKHRGYHISALYSPIGLGYSWAELARQWIEAQDDVAKLKSFINNRLGEPWEDRRTALGERELAARAEPYALRSVPPGCLVITAGVDTQGDRLELQVLGHGRGERAWVLDYVILPGDPSREEVWVALTDYLNRPLVNAHGKEMQIQATAIDTGGHHTHDVYAYVRANLIRRPLAIKGANITGGPILKSRPTAQDINWRGKIIKQGVKLWTVGVDTAKSLIINRLASDTDQPVEARKVRFPEAIDPVYYDGLLSETWDPKRNRWVKKRGRRNEPLDTYVYALAAAHHPEIRVHAMRAIDWERLAALLEPQPLTSDPAAPIPPPIITAPQRRVRGVRA